jgi:hypothetical protein
MMNPDSTIPELEQALALLQAGWRVLVVEDRPYPSPHKVLFEKDGIQHETSYNIFVMLAAERKIRSSGSTWWEGHSAEIYDPDL